MLDPFQGHYGSYRNPPGFLSCILVLRVGSYSLRDQTSLGREGWESSSPETTPSSWMEVSSLLVVVHRDLGESQSSSDAFRDRLQFSLDVQALGNFPSVRLVRTMAGARRSGGAAGNVLGLQPGLPNLQRRMSDRLPWLSVSVSGFPLVDRIPWSKDALFCIPAA